MSVTDAGAEHENSPQLDQLLNRVRDWAATQEEADAVAGSTEETPDAVAGDDAQSGQCAAAATPGEGAGDDDAPETFPRAYVEKLRTESARYRERAHTADAYARRLHTELVRATGKLADPTDLEFDELHLAETRFFPAPAVPLTGLRSSDPSRPLAARS